MSYENFGEGTSHLRRNLALGTAGLVASGATAGYLAYRKRRQEQQRMLDPNQSYVYERDLQIFEQPKLSLETRQLMARIAAAVHIATANTNEPVVNRAELKHIMHESTASDKELDGAIWYLKDSRIIEHRNKILNPKSHGYAELPALQWGLECMDDAPELLVQAHYDIVNDSL